MTSRGRMFLRIAFTSTFADSAEESAFSGSGEARGIEEAHAERLERGRHGICRVLAAAGAHRRDGVFLDAVEILFRHPPGGARTHRLERRHDGELLPLPESGLDGAGVDEDAR